MNRNKIQWSSASATMPGQTTCGDHCLARELSRGMLFAVIDGLGHGPEAAIAAHAAVETLQHCAYEPPVVLIKRCHEAMLSTRGAAMSIASISTATNTLAWMGVGNVEGLLVRSDPDLPSEKLLLRSGVVGYQLPFLQDDVIALNDGDLLILTTDGVDNNFEDHLDVHAPLSAIAERILSTSNKGTDDALVLVARYGGTRS